MAPKGLEPWNRVWSRDTEGPKGRDRREWLDPGQDASLPGTGVGCMREWD